MDYDNKDHTTTAQRNGCAPWILSYYGIIFGLFPATTSLKCSEKLVSVQVSDLMKTFSFHNHNVNLEIFREESKVLEIGHRFLEFSEQSPKITPKFRAWTTKSCSLEYQNCEHIENKIGFIYITLGWVKYDNLYWRHYQLKPYMRGYQPANLRPLPPTVAQRFNLEFWHILPFWSFHTVKSDFWFNMF